MRRSPLRQKQTLGLNVQEVITLGKVLKESELRAFVKCSQFFHYGGLVEETIVQSIVRKTVEYMIAYSLREPITNPALSFKSALRRIWVAENIDEKFSPIESQEFLRAATYALHAIWLALNPTELIPVIGALSHRVVVSKTPIDLHVSGIFRRQKNKELVVPFFTPYAYNHSVETDPVLYLQMNTVAQFGTKHHSRPTVTIIAFQINSSGEVTISEIRDTDYTGVQLKSTERVVMALETGYHYPIVPCAYRCPFKLNCFPGRKDEFIRN